AQSRVRRWACGGHPLPALRAAREPRLGHRRDRPPARVLPLARRRRVSRPPAPAHLLDLGRRAQPLRGAHRLRARPDLPLAGRGGGLRGRGRGGREWTAWEPPLRDRLAGALAEARDTLARACLFHEYVQWIAAEQWAAARREATALGVRLMGDLAFMLSADSADVWARQEEF